MTTTKEETLQEVLEKADPNQLADALRKLGLSFAGQPIKVTFTGLTDVAGQDITTAAAKAAATVENIVLEDGENLPAIGSILALRTTAGTLATHGVHVVGDAGTTELVPQADSPGVASISDDGTTLTFQAGVTAFILEYIPRPKTALTSKFAPST